MELFAAHGAHFPIHLHLAFGYGDLGFAAGAYRTAEFKEAIQLDEFGLDGDGFHMVTLS